VQGNVTVPRGGWCDLIDTSVAGNLEADRRQDQPQ
jgi:hypothetical protein